ncbi:hypothetical protein F5884DRAFT_805435 [Xylogone sp. PMI_703]|nr:hypothetical protein F5884DRAFT_805435 [Xylogone sp. PMI_703]
MGSHDTSEQLARRVPYLDQLPPEVLQIIVELLPLKAVAELSLTSGYLYKMFGVKTPETLRKPENHKSLYALQIGLADNLPEHIACFHCKCYHYIDTETAPRYMLDEKALFRDKLCVRSTLLMGGVGRLFSPMACFMAMKRYRQGRDYGGMLKLLAPRQLHFDLWPELQWNCSSARIVDDKLLFRRQTVAVPGVVETGTLLSRYRVCSHMLIKLKVGGAVCVSDVPHKVLKWRFNPNAEEMENKILMQCRLCYTEFQAYYKEILNGKRRGLFITVYKDFGEGKSYLDPKWQSHLLVNQMSMQYPPREVEFETGSICSAFERRMTEKQCQLIFDSPMTESEEKDLGEIDRAFARKDDDEIKAAVHKFFHEAGEQDGDGAFQKRINYYSGCEGLASLA